MPPRASIIALMPVLAARAMGRPSSIARIRAISRCWFGPAQGPNQESSVTLTSQPGRPEARGTAPGNIAS